MRFSTPSRCRRSSPITNTSVLAMRIVLLGGGGHASDVLGAIEALRDQLGSGSSRLSVAGILADGDVDMKRFAHRGVKHLGTLDHLKSVDASHYIACVGYPEGRKQVVQRVKGTDKQAASIVHPRAWLPEGTVVGGGTVVLAGVCV